MLTIRHWASSVRLPTQPLVQAINSGVAVGTSQTDKAFDPSALGRVEYYQKTSGQSYSGMSAVKSQIQFIVSLKAKIDSMLVELTAQYNNLTKLKAELADLNAQMNALRASCDTQTFNALVPTYNTKASDYNNKLSDYQAKVELYNLDIVQYNQA
ncbi:MAG: hypothetical protein WCO55_04620 [Candidatus Falkowbacteria bacterium]